MKLHIIRIAKIRALTTKATTFRDFLNVEFCILLLPNRPAFSARDDIRFQRFSDGLRAISNTPNTSNEYRQPHEDEVDRDNSPEESVVPRMTFAGRDDVIVATPVIARIGPLIAEHREELIAIGWTVRLVDGFQHELGGRPDVVVPLVREFLDPLLLRV